MRLLGHILNEDTSGGASLLSLRILGRFMLASRTRVVCAFYRSRSGGGLFLMARGDGLLVFSLRARGLSTIIALFADQPSSCRVSSLIYSGSCL